MDVALFEFSQPIKVNSVKVDQVSNRPADRGRCMQRRAELRQRAEGSHRRVHGQEQERHARRATFTHQIGLTGVRYLVVGARPDSTRPNANSLAPITAGSKNGDFYIEAIDFTK